MRMPTFSLRLLAPLLSGFAFPVLALPASASAETSFVQAIGLFNVFVGLMLTVALITYGAGFVIWITRLGTWPTYRTEAIKIMEWSVVILFVLVVLLAIVQFFQYHPREAAFVVSVIVGLAIVGIIIFLVSRPAEKKKEER